jgi:hypothetical protein
MNRSVPKYTNRRFADQGRNGSPLRTAVGPPGRLIGASRYRAALRWIRPAGTADYAQAKQTMGAFFAFALDNPEGNGATGLSCALGGSPAGG